jgi:DNA-binding IclR family transcriptional regulator
VPVLAGALGKAYLGLIGTSRATEFLSSRPVPHFADRSIKSSETLLAQAALARERGFASEHGEYLPGVAAVAGVFTWAADTYFIWVITMEALRSTEDLERFGREVQASAEQVEQRLAGKGGDANEKAR